MEELKVKDVMTRGVVTVTQEASVAEAVEMLANANISGLAVTSQEGELVGVLSETDIIRIFVERVQTDGDLDKIKVAEIMSTPPITVDREASLKEACRLMCKNNINRLITCQETEEGGKTKLYPAGILSMSDVIKRIASMIWLR